MKRNLDLYISDINEAIKKIEKYTKGMSFEKFIKDDKTIDAVMKNLENIGEAARNIPAEFKAKHSFIPWKEIIGMRNKITHEYFGVDVEILWEAIAKDIPQLKKEIKTL